MLGSRVEPPERESCPPPNTVCLNPGHLVQLVCYFESTVCFYNRSSLIFVLLCRRPDEARGWRATPALVLMVSGHILNLQVCILCIYITSVYITLVGVCVSTVATPPHTPSGVGGRGLVDTLRSTFCFSVLEIKDLSLLRRLATTTTALRRLCTKGARRR